MKSVLASATFLLFLLAGCSAKKVQEPQIVLHDELDKDIETSLAHWERLKDTRGLSYRYTRKSPSAWGGLKSETTITVKDDFVIKREYMALDADNMITTSWTEDGFDALNDHPEGAPTKRMDELYEDCAQIVATHDDVEVTYDYNGVLKTCHFGKRGIYIENFYFLSD